MKARLAALEAQLANGVPIAQADVAWLIQSLRAVLDADASALDPVPNPAHGSERAPEPEPGADPQEHPTTEELVAEFGLGPAPSADMLAYLRGFVRDREREAAADLDGLDDEG